MVNLGISLKTKKKITSEGFAKNVITLMSGTTLAQILSIIASPFLTRMYSPEEFGVFGIYIAVISLFSVVVCGKYEMAIVLPEKDKDAINILILSVGIASIVSLILMFALLIIPSSLLRAINISQNLISYIWVIPISVLLTGLFQSLNKWAIRKKTFKIIALAQVNKSTTTIGSQLIYNYQFILMSNGLVVGQIFGFLFATTLLAYQLLKRDFNIIKKYGNFTSIKRMLVRYKQFPIYSIWSGLLNTGSVQLPLFMLAFFFNPVIVGYYTLANRLLTIPISVLGTSVSQVFLQQATEENRRGNLGDFSLSVFSKMLSIGLTPMIMVSIVSPELFSVVFGQAWYNSGVYVQWLTVWLLFVFISSPISGIFIILEKQKESMIFNGILFSSRIFVLLIGGLLGSPLLSIALFGITGAFLWFIQIVWLLNIVGIKVIRVIKLLFNEVVKSIPFIGTLYLIKQTVHSDILLIVLALIIGLLFLLVIYRQYKKTLIY